MYVCICNSITDRQVKSAIELGAEGWREVQAHFGCEPSCGKCECEIIDAITEQQVITLKSENAIQTTPALALAD
jgi:bacterioferritin-associated ferredoxin